ncbi:CHAT domain-containing protein [Myxococcus sp. K15C18031901]|uniref:CHAT domain-containing protein n=1 Tax=Myxococcus dinghuensis TaxID=2906761 RepID=UPI0020A8042E|nr:CHAT domain-containing protein [Myxococcus dinghuensis]MCP3099899.1 CHAT domain-containing protein [Myxococcus dinghuensis]
MRPQHATIRDTSEAPLRILLKVVRAAPENGTFIEPSGRQAYRVFVDDHWSSAVSLDWGEVTPYLSDLASTEEARAPSAARELGARLTGLLTQVPTWAIATEHMREALRQGRPVDLLIQSEAPELYGLPWELVAGPNGLALSSNSSVLVQYMWPSASTTTAQDVLARDRSGPIVFGQAGDVELLRLDRDVVACCEAVDFPRRSLHLLPQMSLRSLGETLGALTGPVAVLQWLCHGARAPDGSFGLAIPTSDDPHVPHVGDAEQMAQVVGSPASRVRLLLITACQGGDTARSTALRSSVVQQLHRAGVSVAVASRLPLSTRGAQQLTRALYAHLLRGGNIREALCAARSALYANGTLDWASLQVYVAHEEALYAPLFPTPATSSTHQETSSSWQGGEADLPTDEELIEIAVRGLDPTALKRLAARLNVPLAVHTDNSTQEEQTREFLQDVQRRGLLARFQTLMLRHHARLVEHQLSRLREA